MQQIVDAAGQKFAVADLTGIWCVQARTLLANVIPAMNEISTPDRGVEPHRKGNIKMIALVNLGIAAALAVVALGLQFQTVFLGQIAIGTIAAVNASDLIGSRLPSLRLIPSVSPLFQTRGFELGALVVALGLALFCALWGSEP